MKIFSNAAWLVALCVVFFSISVQAAPYGPNGLVVDYVQPDGTTFPVRVLGDEFYAVEQTLDGYTVIKDPQSGFWCYAEVNADGSALISTGIVVKNSGGLRGGQSEEIPDLPKNVQISSEAITAQIETRQDLLRRDAKGRLLDTQPLRGLDGEETPTVKPGPPGNQTVGDQVGLCILVEFSDQPGTFTPAQVDAHLNQPTGYTAFGNACSVNEYFRIQSGGKVNYTNIVTAYVTVPHPKSYYDDGSANNWGNSKSQELINDALDVLIAQDFDFTALTLNERNEIKCLNIYYAGRCSSGWSTGLWPIQWAIPRKTVDATNGISAYWFQMSDMKDALTIGTFCHENGHLMCNFPDLYPYNQGGVSEIGSYSLMSNSGGTHPPNVDPYLKLHAGWAEIIDLTADSHLNGAVKSDHNTFYRLQNPQDFGEYFLIENRNTTLGFEGPFGGASKLTGVDDGLVIYHCLESGSNTGSSLPNDYTRPFELMVVEANRVNENNWWLNPSPYTSAAFEASDNASVDDSAYGLKFWGNNRSESSGFTIHSISNSAETMTFTAGAGAVVGAPEIAVSTTAIHVATDFSVNAVSDSFVLHNAGGGTLNYTISDNANWLSCTPVSGALTTGASKIDVNYDTAGLASGNYQAVITVSDPNAVNSSQTIPVTLTVAAAPQVVLTESSWNKTVESGAVEQLVFRITNGGEGTLNYTISKTQDWVTLSHTTGTVIDEEDYVYVTISAAGLLGGEFTDVVTVTDTVNGGTASIDLNLTVSSDFAVLSPEANSVWVQNELYPITWQSAETITGPVQLALYKGGELYEVISRSTPNNGTFNWTVSPWMAPGSDYQIKISSTEVPARDAFSSGTFSVTDEKVVYATTMDSDPQWSLDSGWEYGAPTGSSSSVFNYLGPDSGSTGTHVLAYRLDNYYENNLSTARYATMPTLDCTGLFNVTLNFERWMGVTPTYATYDTDNITIEASNDNQNWTTIFERADITGSSYDYDWISQTFDISAVADGESTVYIRWGVGPTDISGNYCGWNIDDVVVTGRVVNGLAQVTTATVSQVTATTAAIGGNVTNSGTSNVTERGVCWSTGAKPNVADNKEIIGSGTGSFSASISNLAPNTTYYLRAYASNDSGTAYGQELTFTTNQLVVNSDGVWMNLAGGNWNETSNWTNHTPANGAGFTADFSTLNLTADATVTLDSSRTLERVILGDTTPSADWTLNAANSAVLTLSGTNPGITVTNRETVMNLPVAGSEGLVKLGAGTLTLGTSNSFSGGWTVEAGTLKFSSTGQLANNSVEVEAGASLTYTGGTQTFSNSFNGAGDFTVSGSGNLILNGSNTLSGTVTLNSGLLILNGENTENGQPNLVMNGGTLVIASPFANTTATFGSLSGSSNFNMAYGATTGTRMLSFTQDADTTYSGVISDASSNRLAGLTKLGTGTLTLTGTNTYTGDTHISGGTLVVNGALGHSTVTVEQGATLAGAGTLSGAVTVNGTLNPAGNDVGALTVNNSLALNGTVNLVLNKAGNTLTFDEITGVTTLTCGGTLNITAMGDALSAGDTFDLFDAATVNGEFQTVNLPALSPELYWDRTQLYTNGQITVARQPLPEVNWVLSTNTVNEGDGTARVQIELDQTYPLPVNIAFTVTGSCAVGADLTLSANGFVIPAGQTVGEITVTVNDDLIEEIDETLVLTLGQILNGQMGPINTYTLTVTDNDQPPFTVDVTLQEDLLQWTISDESDVTGYEIEHWFKDTWVSELTVSKGGNYAVRVVEMGSDYRLKITRTTGHVHYFNAEVVGPTEVELTVHAGWNLTMVPLKEANFAPLLDIAVRGLWVWNQDKSLYNLNNQPQTFEGFWFYCLPANVPTETLRIDGSKLLASEQEVVLDSGWNLVGVIKNTPIPENGGFTIYSWNGLVYEEVLETNELQAGSAYWIHHSGENREVWE